MKTTTPNRIDELLAERGISKSELARLAGLHRVSVVRIANGNAEPTLANAIAIARALGCGVEDVFGAKHSHAA